MDAQYSEQDFFRVTSYNIPGTYVREYEQSVIDDGKEVLIAVKRYVPRCNPHPKNGDITFISAPALGVVKETMVPFFEDLTRKLKDRGVGVRGFWLADPLHQGDSAVLNAGNLGNDISMVDHGRDLLQLVQQMRSEMPRPLVGLGHSLGGGQIAYLSLLHPSLFESLLLVEPAIYRNVGSLKDFLGLAKLIAKRRELWSTQQDAVSFVRSNPFYRGWDPRCIEMAVQHSFVSAVESPSAEVQHLISLGKVANPNTAVTTKTPRTTETGGFWRPHDRGNYPARLVAAGGDIGKLTNDQSIIDTVLPYGISVGPDLFRMAPHLRPDIVYFGSDNSMFSEPAMTEERLHLTGSAVDGSGGVKAGKVSQHVISGGDHYDLFRPAQSGKIADIAANHLVLIHERFLKGKKAKMQWMEEGQLANQVGDPALLNSILEWHPKKNPDLARSIQSRRMKMKAKM